MALQLNTTSSIVDFLKSQNKPSDYNSRSSIYQSSGLADRLGPYVGSASQNTSLLKSLSTPTSTGTVTSPPTSTPTQTTPTDSTKQPIGSSGLTASEALSSIPGMPSASDILDKVLNSPGFQNYSQQKSVAEQLATGQAESQKAQLEQQSAIDTRNLVNSLARRNIGLSGVGSIQLNDLATSLASSKLNIDRTLAGTLLQSDLKARNEILSEVQDVIKNAQQGQKDALASLEKVGLTVIGNQVMPTLAARNADLAEANRQADNIRQDQNQQIALARLEQSQASADRAEKYLQLAEQRAAKADSTDSNVIKLSNADKASVQLYGGTIDSALTEPDANGQIATPQEAVQVATAVAAAQGTTLTTTNQVALLDYAKQRSQEIQKQIKEQQAANAAAGILTQTGETISAPKQTFRPDPFAQLKGFFGF